MVSIGAATSHKIRALLPKNNTQKSWFTIASHRYKILVHQTNKARLLIQRHTLRRGKAAPVFLVGSWIPDIGFHGSLGLSPRADWADVALCETVAVAVVTQHNHISNYYIRPIDSLLHSSDLTLFLFPFRFLFSFFLHCICRLWFITRLLRGTTGQNNKLLACFV